MKIKAKNKIKKIAKKVVQKMKKKIIAKKAAPKPKKTNKKIIKKAAPKQKKVIKSKKVKVIVKKPVPKKTSKKQPVKKILSKKKSVKKMIVEKTITRSKPVSSSAKVISGPVDIKPYKIKPGEQYMSEEQLKHFEQVLNLWKSQLMQEVDRTIYDLQDVANYSDPIDRASQEEEFSLKLRERDRERKLLKKIAEALDRIKEHNYGYCDECGAEIGVRRLEARPTATQCIECKTIAEIREKQTGG